MSCPECGTQNQPDSKYCIDCGKSLTPTDDTHTLKETPVPEPSAQAPAASPTSMATPGTPPPASGAAAPVPMPPIPANPTPQAGGADTTAAAVKPDHRRAILITILAALITICVVAGGLVAWNVFGPKTVPQISVDTASDAVSQLEGHGFKVVRKKQYAGAKKGSYLGLDGAKPGDRLNAGSTVTVVESAGPGVPEGTVGLTPDKAEDNLKGMGVTLTEHEVVSDKPGQVVITTPADGDPVTDTQDGIHLGVGVEGEGIPVEIAGQNKDDAQAALEKKGYTVTMEPRFSSRQYLGKIVGANPAIGVKTDTKDVTLYYGVDASGRYEVLDGTLKMGDRSYTQIEHVNRLAGEYCTDGGDCITLDERNSYGAVDAYRVGLNGEGGSDILGDGVLGACPYTQNVNCAPASQTDEEYAKKTTKNHLISGDTGAFELYAGGGLPVCGNLPMSGSPGTYCDNGTPKSDPTASTPSTGVVYKAEDFLLYMPVDADLKTLEADGYFDGKTTYTPDKDRPYVVIRDKTKYSPVDASTIKAYAASPFVPSSNAKPVPFKDAPNTKNVYYLVEKPIDWDLLDGKTISTGGVPSKTKGTSDFTPFAGKYMLSGGAGAWYTSLEMKSDGSFSGHFQDANMGDSGDGYPNGTVEVNDFTGRFKSITKNKDGSYTLECDTSAFQLATTPDESTIRQGVRYHNASGDATGMGPCGTFTGFPDGFDSSAMPEETAAWVNRLGGSGPMLLNNQSESGLPFRSDLS
ncbi:PASTA domain-containing protein [Bifidobacterium miconisargentati]|uniref:PASTA domain-containing protein n=1 Tax=Bifidobacterium miconisargentati TaxID=2834437 RepID=UPI001BDCB248|nr:zinc-ribbon domain-containing protein [Bifidobacterium miconisargentati]MBW3090067.1 zinc-ribbon domain-containing protein [Bifidobacterium miconisargentati]